MNAVMIVRQAIVALAVAPFVGFQLLTAQETPQYRLERDWSMPESIQADRLFHRAAQEFANGSFDSQAQRLLESADTFTRRVFRLPTLKFTRSMTARGEDGDLLLVEWRFGEPSLEGSVILRDTLLFSQYLFRLPGRRVRTSEDVSTLLSQLLVMNEPPVGLTLASLRITVSGDVPIRGFSGTFITPRRANEAVMHFALLGAVTSNGFFLSVRLGKGFTTGYYSVPPFIPERFPPLSELVTTWSSVHIRDELGRRQLSSLVEFRDQILMTELVKRGITKDLFVDLLENTNGVPLDQRAGLLFGTMIDAGLHDLIVRYFRPALAMHERLGRGADDAVLALFRAALQDCPSGVESEVVRLFRSGVFQNAALSYFEHCASSTDSLTLVTSTDVPEDLRQRKESVLRSIKARLAKQGLPLR